MFLLALSTGDSKKSLTLSRQAMKTITGLGEDNLPNKQQFVATLHSCLGSAELELGNYDEALVHFKMDLEIAEQE